MNILIPILISSIAGLIPYPSRVVVFKFGLLLGSLIIISTFLLGMLLVNIINNKIDKINNRSSNLYKVGILSMIALMLHNFPEGIATFMSAYQDINLGINLGIAIMMHNIPEDCIQSVMCYK